MLTKVPDVPNVMEQACAHVEAREGPSSAANGLWNEARKYPRGLAAALVLLSLLLAAAVVGGCLTVWAIRTEAGARTAGQQAAEERDRARKEAEEAKGQRNQAEAARRVLSEERDRAVAAAQSAKRSEEDTKAVLAFFRNKLLSAGHPRGWVGGNWAGASSKDVTLRQAVDAAEAKVAESFADQPLAEASVRETLGSTYLDLGEAGRAVQQYERALTLREAMLDSDDLLTVACRNQLAVAYRQANRPVEASRLYDPSPDTPSHAAALALHGSTLLSQKKPVEAELKLRECLAIRQKIQPNDWTTLDAKSMLGEALMDQKKFADAEPLLLSGYEGLKQREAKLPPEAKVSLTKALERLVRFHEARGHKDEAARWRKELETSGSTKKS